MENKKPVSGYTVRVYGILTNSNNEVLISKESIDGVAFTKFPGGGNEPGESIYNSLLREFKEESGLEIEVGKLIYVTDFFEESKFLPGKQVLCVYYIVKPINTTQIHNPEKEKDFKNHEILLEWCPKSKIKAETFTFLSDQKARESFILLKE